MDNWEIYNYVKAKKGGSGGQYVKNPALRLIDWEGTVLKEYSAEQSENLTTLPTPSSLRADVDRDLLTFQGYNWALADIKAWVTAHEGRCLTVGAIYTTTDGQDHNYWNNPRLNTAATISKHKRGTTTIGNSAFNGCRSLTSINIPEGVTSIRDNAFYNCSSLTSITIPEGVTSIRDNAFNGCRSLTSINIPEGVSSIGNNAFYNCYSLTSINIPEGVSSIGTNAFNSCYSLTSINIPERVSSIGNNALNSCYSLTSITIPEGVTSIRDNAFNSCYSLTSINIPEGVSSIGTNAFNSCYSLTDIVIKGTPSLANTNAFSNIYSGYLIYVPRSKLSWFETATNWSVFYAQGKIVAVEDYIDYLKSIGIDVREFEGE